MDASELTGPQKQGLLPKLDSAASSLEKGNKNAACGQLASFINSLQPLIDHHDVTAAMGQAWMNTVTNLRNAIGCTSDPCK